jgi:hypothetical protein
MEAGTCDTVLIESLTDIYSAKVLANGRIVMRRMKKRIGLHFSDMTKYNVATLGSLEIVRPAIHLGFEFLS